MLTTSLDSENNVVIVDTGFEHKYPFNPDVKLEDVLTGVSITNSFDALKLVIPLAISKGYTVLEEYARVGFDIGMVHQTSVLVHSWVMYHHSLQKTAVALEVRRGQDGVLSYTVMLVSRDSNKSVNESSYTLDMARLKAVSLDSYMSKIHSMRDNG